MTPWVHWYCGGSYESEPLFYTGLGGTLVRVISGIYAGKIGTVDANVSQRTVDYPNGFAAGPPVVLEDGKWVTERRKFLNFQ